MKIPALAAATAVAALSFSPAAHAAPVSFVPAESAFVATSALYSPADPAMLQTVQYFWGGRNYCFYGDGWHGPGYYWCGYRYRRGYGWGGGYGWHGWGRGGGYHGAGFHGGRGGGFHGGHGGGGFHGGGHEGHGGGHGGHGGGGHHH